MDLLTKVQHPTGDFFDRFEAAYGKALSSDSPVIREALEHIKLTKGKYIRPLLVALSALLCGGEANKEAVNASVILELLHTSSLIHDDVIDNSPERRGQTTLNALYDNHTAVLVGDFVLATGFNYGLMHCKPSLLTMLANAGMMLSIGEISQINATKQSNIIDEGTYFDIIQRKTATLFEAAALFGGLTTASPPETCEKLAQMGRAIGYAFQIKDDIFDYFPSDDLGKPTGIDLQEGKVTLPLIYIYQKAGKPARQEIERLRHQAIRSEAARQRLISMAKEQGGIAMACKRLNEEIIKAKELLGGFSESEAREALVKLCDYLALRHS